MIDLAFIEKLLDLLNRSNAESIEVRRWTTSVRVSKGVGGNSGPTVHASAAPVPAAPPSAGGAGAAGAGAAGAGVERAQWLEIKSPMVGTFYAKPEPGADPYVRVGSRIAAGDTLCIIEAMKIMNPLDSEIAGVIKEVSVEDGQPVEFGHVLFRVDPHG